MRSRLRKGLILWLFFLLLPMVIAGFAAEQAVAETITFEESIPVPDWVRLQYLDKGVEFLNGGRIFQPAVATASGTKALTNDYGQEFDETGKMEIGFTEGQSEVSVMVGLDRDYPYITSGVTAVLSAYGSDTPGSDFITSSTLNLGNAKTPITQELKVTSEDGAIRSVVVEFGGGDVVQFAVEVIDDLTFSTVCTDCTTEDKTAPTVQINKPATDGHRTHNPTIELAFEANDDVGVASIQVLYLDGSDSELESFYPCGSAGVPPCPIQSQTVSYDFYSYMPKDTEKIRVKAWDFTGKTGEADRTIDLVDPGPDMNVWAIGMEITQGTQPWLEENTQKRLSGTSPPMFFYPQAPTAVPLVAGRTTVVRLYGGVEGTTGDMTLLEAKASLRCYQDITYFMPCPGPSVIYPKDQPPTSLGKIELRQDDSLDTKRRDTTLSWNFELPAQWIKAGKIYLEGKVEAPDGTSECTGCGDAANRIRIADIDFNQVPNFEDLVYIVSIGRNFGGTITYPSQPDLDPFLAYLRSTYPVDETTVQTTFDDTWTYDQTSANHAIECGKLLPEMDAHFTNNMQGREAIHGFIDPVYPCSGRGGGSFAFTRVNGPPKVAAEETGHEFGLKHAGPPPGHAAECTAAAGGCDSDWPWPHGGIGAFGFDILNMEVIPKDRPECQTPGACDDGADNDGDTLIDEECADLPDSDPPADLMADPHDFMSYGGCTSWVSPRTWIRLYNAFTDSNLTYPKNPTQSSSAGAALLMGASGTSNSANGSETLSRYLLVRGEADASGTWSLLPSYELDLPAGSNDEPGSGEYTIELRDGEGTAVWTRQFSLVPGHIDMEDPWSLIVAPPSFSEVVPLDDGVVSVVLLRGTEVVAEITRSPNPPEVQLFSPTRSGFEGQPDNPVIRWTGSDIDNGPLHYMVDYSPVSEGQGGPKWKPLAIDWTRQELPVRLLDLPGGGEAMVRLLATDGFNTTVAVSPPFFVANKGPRAEILSPLGYALIKEGQRIVLRGAASDREDGTLPAEALTWNSSLDGMLGTGRRVDATSLSPGVHEITLAATDTDGQMGSDVTVIEVTELPNSQPLANAGPDIITLPGSIAQLDGTGSSDADNDSLTFYWRIVSQTPGSNPILTNSGQAEASLFSASEATYELELIVHDGQVGSVPDRLVVNFENRSPVAMCINVTVDADENCQAYASIDGGSYDPDEGDVATILEEPAGPYGLGSTGVTLTITDSFGSSDSCTGKVTVKDTTPPSIGSLSVSPNVLWPPNHKMVPVAVTASVFDNCDKTPGCRISSVSSNEPGNALGDGNTTPDWEIIGDMLVHLRSERSGTSTGRAYTITVECTDASGNSSTEKAVVIIPHDQSSGKKQAKK